MNKPLIILVIIFILISVSFYSVAILNKDSIEKYLQDWQISIDIPEFVFEDFSNEKTKFFEKEKLEIKRGETIMRITKVETDSPRKYVEDKKFLLESLFSQTAAPYPGVITNVIECPEEFKPKITEVKNGTIYTLFAGERFTYGICTRDLIAYYSTYGIFECGNNVFEVNIYADKEEDLRHIGESFRC